MVQPSQTCAQALAMMMRVSAAPAAQGSGAEPELVAEQVCHGGADVAEQVCHGDDPAVEPSVEMNSGEDDMEKLRADKATPLTPAMESSCASGSAQQTDLMVPYVDSNDEPGDAIVERTSDATSNKPRGPNVHQSPPSLSSIAPPGCSIILNSILAELIICKFC